MIRARGFLSVHDETSDCCIDGWARIIRIVKSEGGPAADWIAKQAIAGRSDAPRCAPGVFVARNELRHRTQLDATS
jgi:hypothetical protein